MLDGCSTEKVELSPSFDADTVADATYNGLSVVEKPVTLDGGVWSGDENGGAIRTNVRLVSTQPVIGNLDADPDPEAVVLLAESGGGSGTFYSIAVLEQFPYELANTATAPLGDRVDVNSISIEDGVAVVDMVRAGPEDPACCPTEHVRQTWSYSGTDLTEESVTILEPLGEV